MKKIILLLPLVILAASIAGIFILDGTKNDEISAPAPKKKGIQKLERETIAFNGVIDNYFSLLSGDAVEYKNLQIYPIMASGQYIEDHKNLEYCLNLAEALAENKVKIMELGESERETNPEAEYNFDPIGGSFDPSAFVQDMTVQDAMEAGASVNTLTIENISDKPIYIMAGDVVIGGNQDRVIAEDMIAMPNSGKIAIPVFCVEPGRWSPRENPSNPATNGKQDKDAIFAFTGYFNVASNSIREAVKNDKDQSQVWAKVGDMRSRHHAGQAESTTYGDLAKSSSFTKARDEYIAKFANAFNNYKSKDIIGCIVVSGDKVLACDIFGTPALFQKQYKVLLHAYVSDAMTYGAKPSLNQEQITSYFNKSVEKYFTTQADKQKELDTKFVHHKKIVHFSNL
jgi:hypothetical protein